MRYILILLSFLICSDAFAQFPVGINKFDVRDPVEVYKNRVLARDSVVAFYSFEESPLVDGTIITDETGTHDGVVSEPSGFGIQSGTGLYPRRGSSVIYGISDAAIVSLAPLDVSGDWSIELGIGFSALSDGPLLTVMGGTGSDVNLFQIDTATDGIYWTWDGGVKNFDNALLVDQSNHVVVSFNSATSEFTFYLNSFPVDTVTVVTPPDADGLIRLGVNVAETTTLIETKIDNLVVYNDVATPDLVRRYHRERLGVNYTLTDYELNIFNPPVFNFTTFDEPKQVHIWNHIGRPGYHKLANHVLTKVSGPNLTCGLIDPADDPREMSIYINPPGGVYDPVTDVPCVFALTGPDESVTEFTIQLRITDGDGDGGEGPAIAVNNQEDLEALRMPVDSLGARRLREGYYSPGDGGGLIFTLIQSNQYPMVPGMIFPAGARISKSDFTSLPGSGGVDISTSCAPVVPGTLHGEITGTDFGGNPFSFKFTDAYLFGVNGPTGSENDAIFDHRKGRFEEIKVGGYNIQTMLNNHLSNGVGPYSANIRLDYDCATDGMLWVATHTSDDISLSNMRRWDARWTGAKSDPVNGPYTYQDVLPPLGWLARATIYHNRFNSDSPITDIKNIILSDQECIPAKGGQGTACDGERFWRTGAIKMPDGVFLTGSQGTTVIEDSVFVADVAVGPDITKTLDVPIVTDSSTYLTTVPPASYDPTGCATDGAFCRRMLATHQMLDKIYSDPIHMAPDSVGLFGHWFPTIINETGSREQSGLFDIVIDSYGIAHGEDVFGNETPWGDLTGDYSFLDLQETIWNTPAGDGYANSPHGGQTYGGNFEMLIENSAIIDNLGSAVLTLAISRNTSDKIRRSVLGASRWNHNLYNYGCVELEDVAFEGNSWDGYIEGYCVYGDGVLFSNLAPSRRVSAAYILNNRNGVATPDTVDSFLDPSQNRGYENGPFRINNFWFDLRGVNTVQSGPNAGDPVSPDNAARITLLSAGGPGMSLTNGVVIVSDKQPIQLYSDALSSEDKAVQWADFTVDNIEWIQAGTEVLLGVGLTFLDKNSLWNPRVSNINFHVLDGVSSFRKWNTCLELSATRVNYESPTTNNYDDFTQAVYSNLGTATSPMICSSLFDIQTKNDMVQRSFIVNSYFENDGGILGYLDGDRNRRLEDECPTWPTMTGGGCRGIDSTQVYIKGGEFSINPSALPSQYALAATWRLDGVTDPKTGLTSEASEVIVCSGGETELTFQPGLFWPIHPTRGSVVLTSGAGTTANGYVLLDDNDDVINIAPGGTSPKTMEDYKIRVTLSQPCTPAESVTGTFKIAEFVDHLGDPVTVPITPVASDTVSMGNWTWVDLPAMKCRTGEASGYAYKTSPVGYDSLFVHNEGGGAGFDLGTYNATPRFRKGRDFAEWLAERSINNPDKGPGILSEIESTNPAKNHHQVYIPYCTADVGIGTNPNHNVPNDLVPWYEPDYLGNRNTIGASHDYYKTQQHVGSDNALLVLNDLATRFGLECQDMDLVTYGGMSAGGFNTLGNMETVHDRCAPDPATTPRLLFISDSGTAPRLNSAMPLAVQTLFVNGWDPPIPTGCPVDETTESCGRSDNDIFSNIVKYFLDNNPDVTLGIVSHLEDKVIRSFFSHSEECQRDCLNGPTPVSGAQYEAGLYDLRDFWPSNFVSYYIPGGSHTISVKEDFYNVSVEGVTVAEWYRDLFQGIENHIPSNTDAENIATPAANPISIPTYDGSGQSTHPDVLDMAWELDERGFGGTTWNGYRYWMVHTPYPFADGDLENPSILVSNTGADGSWAAPAGLTNPIYPHPSGADGINSDPDIVLNATADTMFVVWRNAQYQGLNNARTLIGYSLDGVTWSALEEKTSSTGGTGQDYDMLSPSVVYNSTSGEFEIYAVGRGVGGDRSNNVLIRRTTDYIRSTWSSIDLTLNFSGVPAPDYIWHIDVRRDLISGGGYEYRMAMSAWNGATGGSPDGADFYYCTSSDGISFNCEVLMYFNTLISWTEAGYYRGSLVPTGTPGSAPTGYRMWYSGIDDSNRWRVGETSWTF